MFGWFKKLLPMRAPEGSHETLVKELIAVVRFFGLDAAEFGVAMVNKKINVAFLLHETDGALRRQALVGLLLKDKWIPQHRYDFVLGQEGKADKLKHWFETGEFVL